mmetsp:Transcript_23627/g.44443  ORF Transcript_23627/g.44443 Transcript_23627/m.44443 type:complete len:203 (-) Transcript_23627:40-648(-)
MDQRTRLHLMNVSDCSSDLRQNAKLLRNTRIRTPLLLLTAGPAADEVLKISIASLHNEAEVVSGGLRRPDQSLGNAQLLGPVLEELLTKGHNIRVRNLDKFCGLHDSLSRGSGVVYFKIFNRKLLRIVVKGMPCLGFFRLLFLSALSLVLGVQLVVAFHGRENDYSECALSQRLVYVVLIFRVEDPLFFVFGTCEDLDKALN